MCPTRKKWWEENKDKDVEELITSSKDFYMRFPPAIFREWWRVPDYYRRTVWEISKDDAQKVLKAYRYKKCDKEHPPQPGDLIVYRNKFGNIIHLEFMKAPLKENIITNDLRHITIEYYYAEQENPEKVMYMLSPIEQSKCGFLGIEVLFLMIVLYSVKRIYAHLKMLNADCT